MMVRVARSCIRKDYDGDGDGDHDDDDDGFAQFYRTSREKPLFASVKSFSMNTICPMMVGWLKVH